ncbi:MAG: hypothetical protein COX80_01290 [Candidatus Magasanikbacteria bacterium CG_4_10_14_0_2_um_filter_33_14]|uniref:Uncharacterized protein n=1 Tax=Candidatus Magasanikbacteria bacterium CG_4_10_14_0_2_um_filter_33_14 TaxID=1974636 RepID=A0A2M7VBJ6_9BACT|nr:MAG: hypothetical protein COX80_01290 [Candidatus Magasanikbacteria bacterium CG_4_10_14_0_2_um_filter_33_14]
MSKKILQFLGILVVIFLLVSLAIGLMYIWNMLDKAVALDAFWKTSYTLGAIFLVGVLIMLITGSLEKK